MSLSKPFEWRALSGAGALDDTEVQTFTSPSGYQTHCVGPKIAERTIMWEAIAPGQSGKVYSFE